MNSATASGFPAFNDDMIPRFREVGEVTLDLFHRDGRVTDRWLGFHPREFELVWRLAEEPGTRVSKQQLLLDVWRLNFEPDTNTVAVHVARVRSKLSLFGLNELVETHPDGGYLLAVPPDPPTFTFGLKPDH